MRLTTKGRFAVSAMLDIALQEAGKPVTLAGVSERQNISLSYLEQLFSRLRRAGLVSSVRGPGGGYCLTKNPAEITVSDVIAAADELIDATQCGGHQNCRNDLPCSTHALWTNLNDKILDFLSGITIADLVATQAIPNEEQKIEFIRKVAPASIQSVPVQEAATV
ncbi:MAG: Rrf2 family transcriptional regulator [Methylophilaceae bacterium]|nr:Rrf2 family transcriptional regulator [Methylophilaceae bacterium]